MALKRINKELADLGRYASNIPLPFGCAPTTASGVNPQAVGEVGL